MIAMNRLSHEQLSLRNAACYLVLLALALPFVATAPLHAEEPEEPKPESQPTSQPDSQPTTTSTSTTTTSQEDEEDEEEDEYLAILNGRVVTVSGPTLRQASILVKNGKIAEIAPEIVIPDEATVIDAKGKWVYPGLIAASAGGIHGGGKADDTTDVFSLNMTVALAGGITSAIAGNDAAKLTYGTTDGMIIKRGLYTNIGRSWRGPMALADFRADLQKVRDYLRDLEAHKIEKETDKEAKPPAKDWLKGKYANYLKLLKRETTAVASANQAQDLLTLAGLARDFDFRLVIRGGYEAWTVADKLARADIAIILTPRTVVDGDDRSNRPTGASLETAKILADHGIPFAIVPPTTSITLWGLAGRDLLHLNMEAAFAVRGGLSEAQALRAITLDAARVLGIDKSVGSIEVGKDADLVVADGDPLYFMTQVHHTIVNGKVAYAKEKDTLFAHIRPEGNQIVPDFDDVWPRKLAWPDDHAGSVIHGEKKKKAAKEAEEKKKAAEEKAAAEKKAADEKAAKAAEKEEKPATDAGKEKESDKPKSEDEPADSPPSDKPEPAEEPALR